MTLNEIKKALYKEKPMAVKTNFIGGYVYYVAQLSDKSIVEFNVPNSEAKGFEDEIPAQLLIRWIN